MIIAKSKSQKIGIFIIAYNAAQTLISAYKRIPEEVKRKAKEIYVFDDCSDDNTYYAGLGYKIANKIKNFTLYKNPKNLGYGGNQKKGYRYAIKKYYDIVVMLHGDAQYAPEKMPNLLAPFESKDWEKIGVVMGSRMLGDPLRGKMPYYKYAGNKILTFLENLILGTNLSEFHSGYRAYNLNALKNIPFEECSNDFHFDTQILILLLKANYQIKEVPIPTYYGAGSKSYVNVLKYGLQCLKSVIEFRLSNLGVINNSLYQFSYKFRDNYEYKSDQKSSHTQIAEWIRNSNGVNILDIGCANGMLVKALGKDWSGNIVGIDKNSNLKNSPFFDKYKKVFWSDLNKDTLSDSFHFMRYDSVVIADVLEHLERPDELLLKLGKVLNYKFNLYISVPNDNYLPTFLFKKIFPNFKMSKGPLDKTHVNFYSLKEIKSLLEFSGFEIKDIKHSSPPTYLIYSKFNQDSLVYKVCDALAKVLPELFAYQNLLLCQPKNLIK